ncbi:MAG: hypothetical protein WC314_19100 [Vulcanimicrobiota bacterium]
MNYDAALMNSMATLQKARTAQLASLASARYGAPVATPTLPSFPMDTVSLGNYPGDPGLIPDPRKMAQMMPGFDIPLSSDPDYLQRHEAIYDQLLKQIMEMKALEAAQGGSEGKGTDGSKSSTSKGNLNVVAGGRSDGVKAKKVTIHKDNNYSSRQYNENIAEYNKHESRFEGAQVGEYYDVWVEWEDGTTTHREVRMDSPGQTVYIDSQY